MPITPLHFGAALPFQWALRERFSALAFVVANVAMDIQPVLALGFGVPVAVHGWTHTLLGASTIAAALTASAWRLPRRRAYALGFFVGTLSHVALDSCMHHDVSAFAPFREGKSPHRAHQLRHQPRDAAAERAAAPADPLAHAPRRLAEPPPEQARAPARDVRRHRGGRPSTATLRGLSVGSKAATTSAS